MGRTVTAGIAESNSILLLGLIQISPVNWLPSSWEQLQAMHKDLQVWDYLQPAGWINTSYNHAQWP